MVESNAPTVTALFGFMGFGMAESECSGSVGLISHASMTGPTINLKIAINLAGANNGST